MINARELSKKLGMHYNTIYKWIKNGMPCIKTGKEYLVDFEEVIKWLKENDSRKGE